MQLSAIQPAAIIQQKRGGRVQQPATSAGPFSGGVASGLKADMLTFGALKPTLPDVKVLRVEEPVLRWLPEHINPVGPDGLETRNRKVIPNELGIAHSGFADAQPGHVYDRYYLMDPVSEPLIFNSKARLTPDNMRKAWDAIERTGIFKFPIFNPDMESGNINGYLVPWQGGFYTQDELNKILEKPINQRDPYSLTYVSGEGSPYKSAYTHFWIRGNEAVAYAHTNSQHPDPAVRERDHRLGARLTLTTLSRFVSHPQNIYVARAYKPEGDMTILGAVRALIDDEVRDQIRGGKWTEHIIHIKGRTSGARMDDEHWPQFQNDAYGMHLAALAKHLREPDCLKWDALTDQEKKAVTVLYAYMIRLKYWDTPDSGAWEFDPPEGLMIRSSSVGMATNGMRELQKLLFAPDGSGEPIRAWMRDYLEQKVSPLVPEGKREAFWRELVEPLTSEGEFERQAVAPGYRRLYHQLPFEGLHGLDMTKLDDAKNLYQPYDAQKNPGFWDSAVLFIPRFAPELMDDMARMRGLYFPNDQVSPELLALRNRYARGVNAQAETGDQQTDNLDFIPQILNSNLEQLRRRTGIIRYHKDHYQNSMVYWDRYNELKPFHGRMGTEPEWTNFPPMQATTWFNRYLKTGNEEDFLKGVDAWNLTISALTTYRDVRDGKVKVKMPEHIKPLPPENGEYKAVYPLITDLFWSHADTKSAWEAFQKAYQKYAGLAPEQSQALAQTSPESGGRLNGLKTSLLGLWDKVGTRLGLR